MATSTLADLKRAWLLGSLGLPSTTTIDLDTLTAMFLSTVNPRQGDPSPAQHGFTAWSQDPALIQNFDAPSVGVMHLIKVFMTQSATINRIWYYVNAAGNTLVANNKVGLYDLVGNRLGVSADLTTTDFTSAGIKSTTITPGVVVQSGVAYFIVFLANGTTAPTLGRMGVALGASYMNAGPSTPNRYATKGAAVGDLLTPVDFSVIGLDTRAWWMAVSP